MPAPRRLRRGIYLLPTLFTVGNLFCGFFSFVESSKGSFELAAFLILAAGILDLLDGKIARMTGTTSEFGVEFDSLADLVSFGVAPAFLAHQWALAPLGRPGWLVAFLFVVCAAMRLARFNIQGHAGNKRYFAGLPAPPAAAALACLAYAFPSPPESRWVAAVLAVAVVTVALLMVSRVRYRSFKDIDLRNRRSYVYVLPLAAAVVAIAIHPASAAVAIPGLYVLSGPATYVWGLLRRSRAARAGAEERPSASEVADGRFAR